MGPPSNLFLSLPLFCPYKQVLQTVSHCACCEHPHHVMFPMCTGGKIIVFFNSRWQDKWLMRAISFYPSPDMSTHRSQFNPGSWLRSINSSLFFCVKYDFDISRKVYLYRNNHNTRRHFSPRHCCLNFPCKNIPRNSTGVYVHLNTTQRKLCGQNMNAFCLFCFFPWIMWQVAIHLSAWAQLSRKGIGKKEGFWYNCFNNLQLKLIFILQLKKKEKWLAKGVLPD